MFYLARGYMKITVKEIETVSTPLILTDDIRGITEIIFY